MPNDLTPIPPGFPVKKLPARVAQGAHLPKQTRRGDSKGDKVSPLKSTALGGLYMRRKLLASIGTPSRNK